MRRFVVRLAVSFLSVVAGRPALAADPVRVEVKRAHFTVVSDSGEKSARAIVLQFEQIRSAIHTIWALAATMVLGSDCRLVNDPYGEERLALKAIRERTGGPA